MQKRRLANEANASTVVEAPTMPQITKKVTNEKSSKKEVTQQEAKQKTKTASVSKKEKAELLRQFVIYDETGKAKGVKDDAPEWLKTEFEKFKTRQKND